MNTLPRILIIEGPDGAGKTTLIQELRDTTPGVIVAPRASDSLRGLRGLPIDYLGRSAQLVTWFRSVQTPATLLFDRHSLYSEPIYSRALGRPTPTCLANYLNQVGPWWREATQLVICLPPLKEVRKNVLATPQMVGVTDALSAIYQGYQELALNEPGSITFDYTRDGLEKVRNALSN